MKKPIKVQDKYYLKSLHEEIDLYDRKLAHMAKYEIFASEEDRTKAVEKMTTKRATLVRIAQKLAEDGIEFHPSDLPRSFRAEIGGTEIGGTEIGGTEIGSTEIGGTEIGSTEIGSIEHANIA